MTIKFSKFWPLLGLIIILTACEKELSLDNGGFGGVPSNTSEYTLSGAPGACTSPVIAGTFKVGTALDVSNEMTAEVNVTTIGTFSITTGTVNGVGFTASGNFITTGPQNVVFTATGTPLASGTFNFTLGTGGCTFSIDFQPGTPSTSDCKACGYIPMCVGSKYTYADTVSGTGSISVKDVLASVDTTIDNKTYQKITLTSGVNYVNCTNGETNLIGYQLTSVNGNTLEKIQTTILKSNGVEGTTWTDKISNPLGQEVSQRYTILTKGITRAVGGFDFADVIKVRLETGIEAPAPIGFIVAVVTDYYYAKGVGMVEAISSDPNTGDVFLHSVLQSYFIP